MQRRMRQRGSCRGHWVILRKRCCDYRTPTPSIKRLSRLCDEKTQANGKCWREIEPEKSEQTGTWFALCRLTGIDSNAISRKEHRHDTRNHSQTCGSCPQRSDCGRADGT